MHLYVHCMLFTISKIWKQPKCLLVDDWIKNAIVHLHNGILLGCKKKKKEIFAFATTWMVLEGIILGEISQSEKDNYHIILLTCGI